ncbi:MAG: RNA 2',3'-cyclic phosphodiesterase [Acidimicrobiales bacterium]
MRLFVAVWPPPALVEQLRSMQRPDLPGVRWTSDDQWHVTLRFLGTLDADSCEDLLGALGRVATECSPVEVTARRAPLGLGQAAWVLPVEGLDGLARAVAEATAGLGRPPDRRGYRCHLTLARARTAAALRALRRSGQPADPPSAGWTVGEITLVQSDLRPSGARYEVVSRWALGGNGM